MGQMRPTQSQLRHRVHLSVGNNSASVDEAQGALSELVPNQDRKTSTH